MDVLRQLRPDLRRVHEEEVELEELLEEEQSIRESHEETVGQPPPFS